MSRKPYSSRRRMTTGEITGLVVFAVIGIIAIVCALMDSGNEENNTTRALSPAMQRIESHRATDSASVKSRRRYLRDKKDSTTTHVIKSKKHNVPKTNRTPRSRDYIDG